MKERIQKYMDFKNINAGELAMSLDVQRSNISHILNGRNKPSAAFIEKMLNVYPDMDARWLLTGEGNMINSQGLAGKLDLTIEAVSEEKKNSTTKVPDFNVKDLAPDTNNSAEIHNDNINDNEIARIVIFYKDGTFLSYLKR